MAEDVQPLAVTTIGLIPANVGYVAYDPNNAATPTVAIIAWLVNENNGVHVTIPITINGDIPAGWKIKDQNYANVPTT